MTGTSGGQRGNREAVAADHGRGDLGGRPGRDHHHQRAHPAPVAAHAGPPELVVGAGRAGRRGDLADRVRHQPGHPAAGRGRPGHARHGDVDHLRGQRAVHGRPVRRRPAGRGVLLQAAARPRPRPGHHQLGAGRLGHRVLGRAGPGAAGRGVPRRPARRDAGRADRRGGVPGPRRHRAARAALPGRPGLDPPHPGRPAPPAAPPLGQVVDGPGRAGGVPGPGGQHQPAGHRGTPWCSRWPW